MHPGAPARALPLASGWQRPSMFVRRGRRCRPRGRWRIPRRVVVHRMGRGAMALGPARRCGHCRGGLGKASTTRRVGARRTRLNAWGMTRRAASAVRAGRAPTTWPSPSAPNAGQMDPKSKCRRRSRAGGPSSTRRRRWRWRRPERAADRSDRAPRRGGCGGRPGALTAKRSASRPTNTMMATRGIHWIRLSGWGFKVGCSGAPRRGQKRAPSRSGEGERTGCGPRRPPDEVAAPRHGRKRPDRSGRSDGHR